MIRRKIFSSFCLLLAVTSFAEKMSVGASHDVYTGILWAKASMNLDSIKLQPGLGSSLVKLESTTDTCFRRRMDSNPYVLATVCNSKPDPVNLRTNVSAGAYLCSVDSLVIFATFDQYLFEEIHWLDTVGAIHLSPTELQQYHAADSNESTLHSFWGIADAWYSVDSAYFFRFIGEENCDYPDTSSLPFPTTFLQTSVQQIGVTFHYQPTLLSWTGVKGTALIKVDLFDAKGNRLLQKSSRPLNERLDFDIPKAVQPRFVVLRNDSGMILWKGSVN